MYTILIIEDNERNSKMLRDLFRSYDYKVVTAADALTGIALAQDVSPDVILVDVKLPDFTGYDVVKHIKKRRTMNNPIVIVVTAFASSEDRELAYSVGCDYYISKPFSLIKLLDIVNQFLQQSRNA